MDYKGIKCPVCEKPFTENDDIVVCPICGAPYHRACYAEKGTCIFTELHEKGESWAPPPPPNAPDTASEIKDKECPNCGTLNAHSALFCNICGTSLTGSPNQHRNSGYTAQNDPRNNGGCVYPPPTMGGVPRGFSGIPFAFDPMGGANPMELLANNVTYGDASKLVQQNSGYYMSVFKYMNTYRRSKFNFSAFLFSGGWLLYRKQYKSGIIVSVLMFLLFIANILLSNLVVSPILLEVIDSYGISASEITYIQLVNILTQYLTDNPMQYLLFCTPLICYALMLAIMIFTGVRGNRMYMNHCIRTVQDIKRTTLNESDSAMVYATRGGVNTAVAFCLLACYFIVRWIPILFM